MIKNQIAFLKISRYFKKNKISIIEIQKYLKKKGLVLIKNNNGEKKIANFFFKDLINKILKKKLAIQEV